MDLTEGGAGRRRRGAELEAAILDAAWRELVESGYAAMSIESVAQRAGTSRSVLYRRWDTKSELVLAAVVHVTRRETPRIPDTGNLRDDLLALMRLSNERRVDSNALLAYYLGAYFQETGSNPRQLREILLRGQTSALDVIIDRAVARGEIAADRLTPRRRTLAFDLFRSEALMTLAPVPDQVILEILDDVFLPLVAPDR